MATLEPAESTTLLRKMNPFYYGSIAVHENEKLKSGKVRKKLNIPQFAVIIFLMCCGGPFGVEPLVRSGGPLLALIGLTVTPIVYCLPQSLMCAELSSMMPSNHGYIVWVYRGLGKFWGFMNAMCNIVTVAFDLPIYPVLMAAYVDALLQQLFGITLSQWGIIFMKWGMIVIAAIVNVLDIDILGHVSVILTILILAPYLIGFFWNINEININEWNAPSLTTDVDWSLFVATLLWLHTGWDCMGLLAGEVAFKTSAFMRAFSIAIALVWTTYIVSVIGALTVPYDRSDWKPGYLVTAYSQILPCLGYATMVSGVLSCFSEYLVELSAQARSLWTVAQPHLVILPNGKLLLETDLDKLRKQDETIAGGGTLSSPTDSELVDYIRSPINAGAYDSGFPTKSGRDLLIERSVTLSSEEIMAGNPTPTTTKDTTTAVAGESQSTTSNTHSNTHSNETDSKTGGGHTQALRAPKCNQSPRDALPMRIDSSAPVIVEQRSTALTPCMSTSRLYRVLSMSRIMRVSIFPSWAGIGTLWERTNAPALAVIYQSLFCAIFCLFNFDFLVSVSVFCNCVSFVCEFAAFLKLRYSEPDAHRPFTAPGGIVGAWLITIIKLGVIGVVFCVMLWEKPFVFAAAVAFQIGLAICYWIREWFERRYNILSPKSQLLQQPTTPLPESLSSVKQDFLP